MCHFNCCTWLLKLDTKLSSFRLLKVTQLAGLSKLELLYLQHDQNESYPLIWLQLANRRILNVSPTPVETSGSRTCKGMPSWPINQRDSGKFYAPYTLPHRTGQGHIVMRRLKSDHQGTSNNSNSAYKMLKYPLHFGTSKSATRRVTRALYWIRLYWI